jgi:hypothetical protein
MGTLRYSQTSYEQDKHWKFWNNEEFMEKEPISDGQPKITKHVFGPLAGRRSAAASTSAQIRFQGSYVSRYEYDLGRK